MRHASVFSGLGAADLAATWNAIVPQVMFEIFRAIETRI